MPSSPKIVIVEDDNDVLFLYKHRLVREDFQVATATNGVDGLALIKKLRPQLILLDLLMPQMGGAEMLAQLRTEEWASDIRVIVLTNISKDEAPPALRFLHVDRYVVKAHHTPAQVAVIVREVLNEK